MAKKQASKKSHKAQLLPILGRWRNHPVRSQALNCKIGDVFYGAANPPTCVTVEVVVPKDHANEEASKLIFKRVGIHLWQRIK